MANKLWPGRCGKDRYGQLLSVAVREAESNALDAERYRKIEAWMKGFGVYVETAEHVYSSTGLSLYLGGPTFDAAVDALPSPEREEAHLSCPDCDKCKRHAYSDATTPGFFYDRCEKHRRPSPGKHVCADPKSCAWCRYDAERAE